MTKKKIVLSLVTLLLLIGAGGISYYYWFENTHFVSTKDARISANLINVTPVIPGKLTVWNVNEGDIVKAGGNLGWQDTGSVATSAGVSANSLNSVGSLTVNKSEITSPITGEVIKTSVEEGQMVSPGQTLAVIADTNDLYVSANIEETNIGKIKVGEPVEVSIDALNGKTTLGTVDEIGKATVSTFSILPTQSSNGNFTKVTQLIPVKIRFPEAQKLSLMPGMSVEVKIHIAG